MNQQNEERERVAEVFGEQSAEWSATARRLRLLAATESDQRAAGLIDKAATEADGRALDWATMAGRLRQPEPAPQPEPPAEPGPPAPSRATIPAWRDPDLRAEPGGR